MALLIGMSEDHKVCPQDRGSRLALLTCCALICCALGCTGIPMVHVQNGLPVNVVIITRSSQYSCASGAEVELLDDGIWYETRIVVGGSVRGYVLQMPPAEYFHEEWFRSHLYVRLGADSAIYVQRRGMGQAREVSRPQPRGFPIRPTQVR